MGAAQGREDTIWRKMTGGKEKAQASRQLQCTALGNSLKVGDAIIIKAYKQEVVKDSLF